jgi:hypothetical protein
LFAFLSEARLCTNALATSIKTFEERIDEAPRWTHAVKAARRMLQIVRDRSAFDSKTGDAKEAPRRTLVDQVLLNALDGVDSAHKYAEECLLYAGQALPTTTVGWGPFDYLVENTIVKEAEETEEPIQEQAEDSSVAKGFSGEKSSSKVNAVSPAYLPSSAIVEVKRRSTFNDNAVAQAWGRSSVMLCYSPFHR